MDCPRCGKATEIREVRGAEVDLCGTCGGIFLDRGELNKVAAATSGDLEFSTIHEESFRHPDRFAVAACPRCADPAMKKVEFIVHTGIILDYCEACGGFWLDGEELFRVNDEVRALNESGSDIGSSPMQWFAEFLFSLPR